MNARIHLLSFFALLILAFAALVGLTWVNYRYAETSPGGNDFLPRWNGARLWTVEGIDPYDPRVDADTQQKIYGRLAQPGEDQALFAYPLYIMVFYAPLGPVDYLSARAVWMTLLEVALAAIGILSLNISGWKLKWPGMAAILLFSLLWYPALRGIILGQFAPLNGLFILAALFLIQRGRDFDAGLLLALSTCKPQMSFLIIVFAFLWSLSSRRSRLALGILSGMTFLIILSLVFLPGWPVEWFWQLIKYPSYTGGVGSLVDVVASGVPGIRTPLSWVLYAVVGVYLLVEWALAWGKDVRWFTWTALLTLVLTNFVAPRTATPHYVVLLPAFFMLFRVWQERWQHGGQQLTWTSLAVGWLGLWAIFLLTLHGNQEAVVNYLPIPIFALLALWWVRASTLRSNRLYFHQLKD